jgi:AraC-like DNA-binding protein/mannose-6-phosphate isomerase-like protein (cupin superfamily)
MPKTTNPADYQHSTHRVVAMAKDFPSGYLTSRHCHERAQLIHAVTGVMRVTTDAGSWVVPPHRAVWVPAGEMHEIRHCGAVAMRTLYIDRSAAAALPQRCGVVEVLPLLRELILAATEQDPDLPDPSGRHALLEQLILCELAVLPAMPLHLPLPRDKNLAAICTALLAAPECSDTLDDWAARVGASRRSLARHFQAEIGMSFGAWRQQLRLIEALTRLAAGQKVTMVAQDLGYDSPSAFTAMFRRALGRTPSQYFSSEMGERAEESLRAAVV